jgi:hypothetical protein
MPPPPVSVEPRGAAAPACPPGAPLAPPAGLPDKLTITVTERLPIAVVKVDGETTGVAGDGQLLTGLEVGGQGLPRIEGSEVSGGRLDEQGSAQAAILAGAPERLAQVDARDTRAEVDVQQERVDPVFRHEVERRGRVLGAEDPIPDVLQQRPQHARKTRVVLHEQDGSLVPSEHVPRGAVSHHRIRISGARVFLHGG